MSIDQGGPKYALGIDFGTSNTVAVARWPDGRARPILVDGSPLLPSAIFADAEGNLLVGRDAVHSARLEPARFEPNPKRRIDDGLVLLGEQEFNVVDLITAVLARVVEEWHRAVGPYKPETTLTCPATWGATRRTLLAEAAARAGLSGVRLVAEPVAAATYFAEVLGRDVPIGSVLMVHDFGAGTFDASLVCRTATGFEVLAVDGHDDLGGLDVDAGLVEHLQTDAWQRLLEPSTLEERRGRRQLWDDVRIAKERLSRAQAADFVVPLLDAEVHLTREELEQVARPVLEQTVRITRNLLKFADLPEGRLAGVFLVGGASRIPLVATLLHRELGEPPVVIEQPELVVAEGSILAGAALLASEPAAPGPTAELRLPSRTVPEFAAEAAQAAEAVQAARAAQTAEAAEAARTAEAAEPTEVAPDLGRMPAVTQPVRAQSIPEAAGATLPKRTPGAAADPARAQAPAPAPAQVKKEPVAVAESPKAAVDNRETEVRPELAVPPHMRPPVDPWPDADPPQWRPDPDATMPTSPPQHEARTPVQPRQASVPTKQAGPKGAGSRPAHPVVAHARPVSPSAPPSGRVAGPASGRAVVAPARPARGPEQQRSEQQRRQPAPARKKPRKRGRSRVLRFLQTLLSVLTMICVPLAALILAYGYGNGVSWHQDAIDVFSDIASLFHLTMK